MKTIMVAIPTYTGTIHAETAQALFAELCEALMKKYHLQVRFHPGNAIISRARNYMISCFLESNADYIVFVDHDVFWQSGDLIKLADFEEDIVAGAYPYRKDPIEFPVRYLPKAELWADEKGLLEVEGCAAGFMCISRNAIETMIAARPDTEYEETAAENKKAWALFDFLKEGKQYYGEDYTFCKIARDCGLKIKIDPRIPLNHIGYKTFSGTLGDWLLNRNRKEILS